MFGPQIKQILKGASSLAVHYTIWKISTVDIYGKTEAFNSETEKIS